MPLVNRILSRKPALLESATKFSMVATLDTQADPAFGPTAISLAGADNNHAGYYLEGSLMRPSAIVTRGGNYPCQSELRDFSRFTTNADYSSFGLTGGQLYIYEYHRFNNVFWACGMTQTGTTQSFVVALPYGGTFNNASSWTNRSAELAPIFSWSSARCMAASSTHIYLVIQDNISSFALRFLRCAIAGAPGNTFTSVSGNVSIGGLFPNAYGVRPDGATQILITNGDVRRSTDSGASWSLVADPGALLGGRDIYYSSAYSRWFANGANGPCYSDGDGASGTWVSSRFNNASGASSPYDFMNVAEQIDPEGRYLIGVTGCDFYRTMMGTYISEDGGANWYHNQNLQPPYYDTSATSANAQPFLLKTDRQILVYQGRIGATWNYDNAVFGTSIINL